LGLLLFKVMWVYLAAPRITSDSTHRRARM
jgi:hypothetical protein